MALKGLLACILLFGCTDSGGEYFGSTKPKHPPDTLWINLNSEPEYIDPGKASDSVAGELCWNMFAGLLQSHPVSLKPMPEIATRWDISKDGRVYTFHLRKSFWSDGTPLTAHDFEWSWKRVLNPATGSRYSSLFFPIENAEPFNLRALFVSNLPVEATEESIRAFFPANLPVERVKLSRHPFGAFAFVKGAGEEAEKNREAVKKFIQSTKFRGNRLSVSIANESLVGAKALDDDTFEARLETSVPFFLSLVTYYALFPVPRHVLDRLAREGKDPDLWNRVENFVSNGPYLLKEWKFRQYMKFEKNPKYWDVTNVRTPKIYGPMVESYNTTLNLYRSGDIDWIGRNTSLPIEFLDRVSQGKDFRRRPYISVYFYWLNIQKPPLDNVKVRKALSLAIDRTSVVKYVTRAGQVPTSDLVPDGLAGYEGPRTPIYDPDRARALLKEAGYKSGAEVPAITLIYNTSEGHKMIAEAIQQMWKKELGIPVNIENQEWKVFLKNQREMNFQISRMGWSGDYPDPYTFLELVAPDNENNHSNWKSREYYNLLQEANRIQVPAERMKVLKSAEMLISESVPLIPIYVYTRSQLVKPYVKGFFTNLQDHTPWKYFWIDTRWYDGVPTEPIDDPPPHE